ncbi:dihydrodipicolinate synthase family protein, partial [Bacillus thuringiensis]|uniref:dihydrodipicolinate synthase family protein n=1 Tax=Bacillus thuringiensis TaxID=1428 RepID=UPI002840846D
AIVVGGTTGESPTLTSEEKVALYRHDVSDVDKRVSIISGPGSNNTHASMDEAKTATEGGVDAVMLVAQYYNQPRQEGMYLHFIAI